MKPNPTKPRESESRSTKDLHLQHKQSVSRVAGARVGQMRNNGNISLAFLRGYQAGYEDRVMGYTPANCAMTTRKEVRENLEE